MAESRLAVRPHGQKVPLGLPTSFADSLFAFAGQRPPFSTAVRLFLELYDYRKFEALSFWGLEVHAEYCRGYKKTFVPSVFLGRDKITGFLDSTVAFWWRTFFFLVEKKKKESPEVRTLVLEDFSVLFPFYLAHLATQDTTPRRL